MTEKLYDMDSHLKAFTACVCSCIPDGERYAVTLNRTAFFPESGGQYADTGTLGNARVLDVQETGGELVHYTDAALPVGETVTGELDWMQRFRRMQNHTGEHILSGFVFRKYGYHNVGFHLADGDMTVDFNGELNRAELDELETLCNLAVAENAPVICRYPSSEELKTMDYRAKLDLTENVRIVEIQGYDRCACCAPHVKQTGEVGSVKILDFMRHRGGTRLKMLCGLDAVEDSRRRYQATLEISGLLSVPQLDTPEAVRKLLENAEELKRQLAEARRTVLRMKAEALPETDGNLTIFEPELDMISLRELVNAGMEKCSGVCAAFSGAEGDWKYIIGSRNIDLRAQSKVINAALCGRGGGKPEMIQGSCTASRQEIEAYFGGKGNS